MSQAVCQAREWDRDGLREMEGQREAGGAEVERQGRRQRDRQTERKRDGEMKQQRQREKETEKHRRV